MYLKPPEIIKTVTFDRLSVFTSAKFCVEGRVSYLKEGVQIFLVNSARKLNPALEAGQLQCQNRAHS